jgi:phasin family protein
MTTKPEDFLLEAWKRQADAGMRLVEAMVEGSTHIRELQLEAAAEAHADLEATRKALAAATDMPRLLKLQTEWAQANTAKCLAYWRSVCEAAMQTDAALVKCACGEAPVAFPEALKLDMIDSAYKQWLETVQRFYKPVEKAAA